MLHPTYYYYLINKYQNKAMGYHCNDQMYKTQPYFTEISDNDHQQLWMIKTSNLENTYYITHCASGLVMEVVKQQKIEMHHMKSKGSQLFNIQIQSGQQHIIWIREHLQMTNLLQFQNNLKCEAVDPSNPKGKWILERAINNQKINHSIIIQCEYSGYVLQVADLAEKQGGNLSQSSWTGMFNQRWVIEKDKQFYALKNLKSQLYASIKNKKVKEGSTLVQSTELANHSNQLWSIQQRGFRIYSIRTAFDPQLFIGTKDHELKQKSEIVLVKDQYKHLWKIIGAFP